MAIVLKINGGWIYLTPTERSCINQIIKLLELTETKDKRLHTRFFQDKLGVSDNTTAHALNLLMSAHIIKPQQYGRVRLYSFVSGWRERLREHTDRIGKDKVENDE